MIFRSGPPDSKDPFADIQAATRMHVRQHGCTAYGFKDGAALIRLASERQAKRVLELGTALGYTACCFAQGSPQAQVDTIEGDATHVRLARAHITQHGLDSRITVHHGLFEDVLGTFRPGYDIAFFDGFAPSMDIVMQLRQLLNEGGLLICSNLQLGSRRDTAQLIAEFADTSRWLRQSPIEGGQTAVLIKHDA